MTTDYQNNMFLAGYRGSSKSKIFYASISTSMTLAWSVYYGSGTLVQANYLAMDKLTLNYFYAAGYSNTHNFNGGNSNN